MAGLRRSSAGGCGKHHPIARLWSRRRLLGGFALSGWALSGGCGRHTELATPSPEERSAAAQADEDFAGLAGFCDGVPEIAADEYAARRGRLCERIREAGFDAILVEAGASLFYLTGVRWGLSERPLLFLLPVDGEPRWIGPAFEAGTLREQADGIGSLELWEEHEGAYERALSGKSGGGLMRVAVDPAMRLFVVEGLRLAAVGVEVTIDPGLLRAARMIKSPAELALLRRANEATKAALAEVSRAVAPGMRESEIAAMVRAAQRSAGLGEIWALVLSGANAAFPHGTEQEGVLKEGEGLLIDTGGALHGYRSDISRTWFVGAPPPEVAAAWEAVREAQSQALAAMRPGASCASIDAIARAVIDGAGHGPGYRHFTHRLGHGIGLQVHEDPYLVGGEQEVLLAPGMVMSNEPGIYVAGEWGIRIEDIVAITEYGAEVFGPRSGPRIDPFAREDG